MSRRADGRQTIAGAPNKRHMAGWFYTDNLSSRASLNALASGLDYVARITVSFILTPLLVAGLGKYLYGAWRVLWQLSGSLWATSGRSAQALQWVIANRQHSPDHEEKRRYLASAVVVWLIFLPILGIVGGLGAWFAPHVLETPPDYVWAVRGAAALLVADAIALTLLGIPRSVLKGENLGYKRMGLSTALILLGGGSMALAVYLDAGVIGVAAAQLANTVLMGALFLRVARRHVPWFGFSRPSRRTVRWFLGLSGWFTGWKLVFELITAADVIVLGFFGSVALVTVYTLTKFVPDALIPLIAILFQGSAPGLGGIIGSGDMQRAIRVRNEIMSFTWVLATVVGATLLLWNRSFVSLWVGREFFAGGLPMLLIIVMVMQFAFIENDARIIDLTLNVRAKVLTGAVSGGLSLGLAAVLVETLDNSIVGIATGMIVGRTLMSVAYPWLVGRFLGHPLTAQLRGVLRPALTTALLFGAILALGRHITVGSWIALVGLGGVTALALALVASLAGLTANQRGALLKRGRNVVRGLGHEGG